MKPFSIICKSCASRLKVTKASAVDQLLACPKCGMMIKVIPPTGWVRPETSNSKVVDPATPRKNPNLNSIPPNATHLSSVVTPDKATQSNFEFDDVDDLLGKPDQVKSAVQAAHHSPSDSDHQTLDSNKSQQPANPTVPAPSPQKKKRPQRANATTDTTSGTGSDTNTPETKAVSEPMLPNQEWESEKSKRQKRLVRILASFLAAIFLIGFIMAMMNSGREMPPMAEQVDKENGGENELAADPDSVAPETDSESSNQDPEQTAIAPEPGQPAPSASNSESESTPKNLIDHSAPPELPSTATKLPEQNSPTTEETNQELEQSALLPSPFRNRNPETKMPSDINIEPSRKQPGVGLVAKMENQIGNLAGLLEEAGTSLSSLRDVALEASGQSIAGIPKYLIEKPGPMKPDLDRLKLNLGGMLFDQTPLPVVVRDLILISGVPITIDARAIEAAGKDVNQSISLSVQDADLDTVIKRILVPLGITKQSDFAGLKFTIANSQELKMASYSLAELAGVGDQGKKRLMAYIQAMIDPQIWVRPENPASLELQGDDILAKCSAGSHAKIKRLIFKLSAANELIAAPTDPTAIAKTLTRSGAITSKLDAPIESMQSIRVPIGQFLTKLQTQSGVTVLVDWENVAKEGWSPKTLIPGNIDESTAGDIVIQVSQAMNLSVVAVDQNTVVLTTPDQAAIARDIEVYSVAKLLAGKFDENHLKQAFETTLGYQLRTEKYVYDASCQCFIVAASQSKQRQVEALLKRLEGI